MHDDAGTLAFDDTGIEGGASADPDDAWDEGVLYDEDAEPDAAALDELTAVEAAEADALEASRAALEEERVRTRTVLERYRALLLAAEPELPAELVQGDTLEELDAAVAGARSAVAAARAALGGGQTVERGFPVGAPARERSSTAGLSASETIRRGLEDRMRTR